MQEFFIIRHYEGGTTEVICLINIESSTRLLSCSGND